MRARPAAEKCVRSFKKTSEQYQQKISDRHECLSLKTNLKKEFLSQVATVETTPERWGFNRSRFYDKPKGMRLYLR
jgi:hypothetical protein